MSDERTPNLALVALARALGRVRLEKGEGSGHPFRGNQWTGGKGGIVGSGNTLSSEIRGRAKSPTGPAPANPADPHDPYVTGGPADNQYFVNSEVKDHGPLRARQRVADQRRKYEDAPDLPKMDHEGHELTNGNDWQKDDRWISAVHNVKTGERVQYPHDNMRDSVLGTAKAKASGTYIDPSQMFDGYGNRAGTFRRWVADDGGEWARGKPGKEVQVFVQGKWAPGVKVPDWAKPPVTKGEGPGHPFRGNQHTGGKGGMSAAVIGRPGVASGTIPSPWTATSLRAPALSPGARENRGTRTSVAYIHHADGSRSEVRAVTRAVPANSLKSGDRVVDHENSVRVVDRVVSGKNSTSVTFVRGPNHPTGEVSSVTGPHKTPVDKIVSMGPAKKTTAEPVPSRYSVPASIAAGGELLGGLLKKEADLSAPTYAVTKSIDEKRYTFGPLYMPNVLDAHKEFVEKEDLQQALWRYVEKTGADRTIFLQHTDKPAGKWVEAATWPVPVEVTLNIPGEVVKGLTRTVSLPAGTTFLGVVWEPWAWDLVKQGRLRGYSLGGKARKERVEVGIRDAEIEKGEGPNHPFRGNQHTGGIGGGLHGRLAAGEGAPLDETTKVALLRQGCIEFGLPTGLSDREEIKRNRMILAMDEHRQAELMGRLSGMSVQESKAYGDALMEKRAGLKELASRGYSTDHQFKGPDGQWTKERQAQHDLLLDHLVKTQSEGVPREGKMQMVGGLPGSGKSYFLDTQGHQHGFQRTREGQGRESVPINPDDFKAILVDRHHPARPPELQGVDMLGTGIRSQASRLGLRGGKEGGDLAGLVHEESSHLAKRFAGQLASQRINHTWDFAMGSSGGVKERVAESRKAGVTPTAVAMVRTPVIVSLQQAAIRHTEGSGRAGGWNLSLDQRLSSSSTRISNEPGGRMTLPSIVLGNVKQNGTLGTMDVFAETRTLFTSSTLVTNKPGQDIRTS